MNHCFLRQENLKRIEDYDNFDIAALHVDILREVDKIEADLEMHDKLIVATSLYYKTALITKDQRIKEAGIVTTIW